MVNNIEKEGLLPIGATLSNGKYRIEKYISSGGFGNTYLATDTAFDERVAIKELYIKGVCGRVNDSQDVSISLTENQRTFTAQQEKFRKEARRLRKLTNDHIVQVHDLFDDNGTSYYVMDFIEGESLSQKLKRTGKPMTESEVMLILPQILDALETVHKEQIWHLDLKPANIMMDKHGNAKLIDFGASKQLRNADGNSLSTSSALAYTPGYASSEQMEQNYEKFGPWTDLYSLGATIYNLLTKSMPPSPSDIAEDAEAALPLPKGVSKKTHDLILWLMRPVRTMRPQCVADVKQFLNEEIPEPKKEEPKTTPESDDTVIKGGSSSGNTGNQTKGEQPKTKPANHGNSKRQHYTAASSVRYVKNRAKKYAMLGVAVVVIAGIAVAYISGVFGESENSNSGSVKTDLANNTPVLTSYTVTDSLVCVKKGPDNMKKYTYTGIVDVKTKLPNGKGTASFDQYKDIPASTYTGNFVNGLCEDSGQASMKFTNGDEYVGSFAGGYYAKGTYKLADGSYFIGSFKQGSPYNGSWYTKDGTPDGKVVNGK